MTAEWLWAARDRRSLATRTQMNSEPHDLSALEEALGHRFQRRALLEQAVTHSSYARETESQNAAEGAAAPSSR